MAALRVERAAPRNRPIESVVSSATPPLPPMAAGAAARLSVIVPVYNERNTLRDLLERRILVLDGAMGTMIQRRRLGEEQFRGERFADLDHDVKGNNELLSLTQPELVRSIHEEYLAAGEPGDPLSAVAAHLRDELRAREIPTLVDELRRMVAAMDPPDDELDKLAALSEAGKAVTGTPSGFNDLDEITGGFQPGNLIILAARPSMGKSALAANFLENAAVRHSKPAVMFSLEMSESELAQRFIASQGSIKGNDLRRGKVSWPKVNTAIKALDAAPLWVDDSSDLSVLDIRAKARRLSGQHAAAAPRPGEAVAQARAARRAGRSSATGPKARSPRRGPHCRQRNRSMTPSPAHWSREAERQSRA